MFNHYSAEQKFHTMIYFSYRKKEVEGIQFLVIIGAPTSHIRLYNIPVILCKKKGEKGKRRYIFHVVLVVKKIINECSSYY